MSQPWSTLPANQAQAALSARVTRLERALGVAQTAAYSARDRRYRLAASQTGLLVGAGQTASVTVTFSSPMPSTDYQVDVAIPALLGQGVSSIAVTNKTINGCTVSFVTPALLALGVVVIVFALSGPVTDSTSTKK